MGLHCRGAPTNAKIPHLCVRKPKIALVGSTIVKTLAEYIKFCNYENTLTPLCIPSVSKISMWWTTVLMIDLQFLTRICLATLKVSFNFETFNLFIEYFRNKTHTIFRGKHQKKHSINHILANINWFSFHGQWSGRYQVHTYVGNSEHQDLLAI